MGDRIYKINQPVLVIFQSLGGETGITDLQMIVTDPQGNDSSPVVMTENSGALYEAEFTPDEIGRWWVKILSNTFLENSQKVSYFVGSQEGVAGVIIQDDEGDIADVTPNGRLKVSQEPPSPPIGTTGVIQTEYGSVSVFDDDEYLIPNGETLILQRFSGGGQEVNFGNVIELWYDPNGDGTAMEIIDAIFCSGTSDQHDLNESFIGDGTRKIRMRRKRLSGGSVDLFGRWEGYY